jgi:hypothetical protein
MAEKGGETLGAQSRLRIGNGGRHGRAIYPSSTVVRELDLTRH